MPSGPLNPQALNRYSYVMNNPLRYVDPTGHDSYELTKEEIADLRNQLQMYRDNGQKINIWAITALEALALDMSRDSDPRFQTAGRVAAGAGILLGALTAQEYNQISSVIDRLSRAYEIASESEGQTAIIDIEHTAFGYQLIIGCKGCAIASKLDDYPIPFGGRRNPVAVGIWSFLQENGARIK